ncbi:MAG: sialidase family protein [Campylobacterota bacterium]|nr:sialidase family protein [Campylobacterota bacterium]
MKKYLILLFVWFGLYLNILYAETEVLPSSNGLVAHYEFEGNLNDSSGNGYHLTAPANALYETGVIGQAYVLNGMDNNLSLTAPLSTSDSATISFWIKGSNSQSVDLSSFQGQIFDLSLLDESESDFILYDDGVNDVIFSFSDSTSSGWHLISVTLDAISNNLVRVYFDGVLRYELSGHSVLFDLLNSIASGVRGMDFIGASVDELQVYNRILTTVDINLIYIQPQAVNDLLFGDVNVSDINGQNSIMYSNTSRNLAVSPDGTIIVVYEDNLGINVVRSTNRGETFSSPIQITTNIGEAEIDISDDGKVYIAWINSTSREIYISKSNDSGLSFETPVVAGIAELSYSLHMAVNENKIFIIPGDGEKVLYSDNRGETFNETSMGSSWAFADIHVDKTTEDVFVIVDNPLVNIAKSDNDGLTFSEYTELNPSIDVFYSVASSSFDYINKFLYISGSGGTAYRIDVESNTSTLLPDIPFSTNLQGRSIDSDSHGNIVIGYTSIDKTYLIVSNNYGETFSIPVEIATSDYLNVSINDTNGDVLALYSKDGNIFLKVYTNLLTGYNYLYNNNFNLPDAGISSVSYLSSSISQALYDTEVAQDFNNTYFYFFGLGQQNNINIGKVFVNNDEFLFSKIEVDSFDKATLSNNSKNDIVRNENIITFYDDSVANVELKYIGVVTNADLNEENISDALIFDTSAVGYEFYLKQLTQECEVMDKITAYTFSDINDLISELSIYNSSSKISIVKPSDSSKVLFVDGSVLGEYDSSTFETTSNVGTYVRHSNINCDQYSNGSKTTVPLTNVLEMNTSLSGYSNVGLGYDGTYAYILRFVPVNSFRKVYVYNESTLQQLMTHNNVPLVPAIDKTIPTTWTYMSLPTNMTLCTSEYQSQLTNICDQNHTIESIFGGVDMIMKHTGDWSYWEQNSTGTYNMDKLTSINHKEGILVKSINKATISIPYDIFSLTPDTLIDLPENGWILAGSNFGQNVTDIKTQVEDQNKTLKYILNYDTNWEIYAPTNDSQIDTSFPRIEKIDNMDGFWLYVE